MAFQKISATKKWRTMANNWGQMRYQFWKLKRQIENFAILAWHDNFGISKLHCPSLPKLEHVSGRWMQQRESGLRSNAKACCTEKGIWYRKTAQRPTTLSWLSPRPNSVSQQSLKSGNILTESTTVLNQWTECCSSLYIQNLQTPSGL